MSPLGLSRNFVLPALAALALGVSACGQKPVGAAHPGPAAPGAYLPPPMVNSAVRLADGSVQLEGSASPAAVVRLRSPDGGMHSANADRDGRWSLELPGAAAPRLFAFEALAAGQTVRGEGALAVMPAPANAAVVLRAGFAAAPSGTGASGRLQLVAFDFDGGSGAAAGFAPVGSPVRLTVDGGVVGLSRADAEGRFAILAVDPRGAIGPGRHAVRIDTPVGFSVERQIDIHAATIPADKAFSVDRVGDGWAIGWRLPGGGAQTSLVFDNAVSAPAATQPPRSAR